VLLSWLWMQCWGWKFLVGQRGRKVQARDDFAQQAPVQNAQKSCCFWLSAEQSAQEKRLIKSVDTSVATSSGNN